MNRFLKKRIPALLTAIIVGACLSGTAYAVPTSVDPGQVEKRFDTRPAAGISSPGVTVAPGPEPAASERLSRKRFTLSGVLLEGNTAFSDDQLRPAYGEFIGREVSLADAQTMVKRITDMYRRNGYVLSQAVVPSQDVRGGVLKVRVIEGYIANVIIQGDLRETGWRNVVEAYADEMKKLRPVRTVDVERYLLLMDDLPGATAKGMVRPSVTAAGAADLVVTLSHKAVEGSYTVDNRGSKYIGPWQHTAQLVANSVFGIYDRTQLRFITTSPTSELRFIDVQHEQPVDAQGTKAALTFSHSTTEPGDALKSLNIDGESNFAQLRISRPIERTRKETLSVYGLFDVRNTDINSAGSNTSTDRLRVARAGLDYDVADRWQGVNLASAQVSRGLNLFNASNTRELTSRTGTGAGFTKLNLDISRTQAVWNEISLFASASGQYAFNKLLAAEQYSLGGDGFGRAFDPSELSGDHALAGKVELRYSRASSLPYLAGYQAYGFYDIGTVWTRGTAAGVNNEKSLSSTGLGVRTYFTDNSYGNAEVAFPLARDVANQGAHGDEARFFVSLTAGF